MTIALVATESVELREQIVSSLDARTHAVACSSRAAALRIVREARPDVVLCDLQISNMGGMAICMDIKLDESVAPSGSARKTPVVLLLDRRSDVFLSRRANADGWLLKPIDPVRVRAAVNAVLSGNRYDDATGTPIPLKVPVPAKPQPIYS